MYIGLSTCGKPFGEALFEQYKKADITHMEISYGKEITDAFDFSLAKAYAQSYGIELWSLHIPFMPFVVIDISNPLLAKKSVAYIARLMEKAADSAGIRRFVIHPSGEPILPPERALRMKTSKESLMLLAQKAKELNAVLCVEDLPRTCLGRNSDEILELTREHEALRVCFDTNHLLKEPIESFIQKTAHKIETLHVSDYDFKDEKHWLPGEGMIDWNALYTQLKNAGYEGAWLYEVSFDGSKGFGRNKKALSCADFTQNARKIFNGEAL